MDLLYDDLYLYIDRINKLNTSANIIICPSNIYLEAFTNNCNWPIGAQNMHYDISKNHTGEISSNQLKSLGIEYVLIGHNERIEEFGENPNIVNNKLIAALDSNIFPILCFGENIDEDYQVKIPKLLDAYLKDIQNIEFITFSYEPVYSIGTGILPTKKKLEEIVTFIKKYLSDKYHTNSVVIYGGSVDNTNINDIMNIDCVDGVIIGSISSDYRNVEKIVKSLE